MINNFNDPLHWVDYQGLTTDIIQGVYLTTTDGDQQL